MTVITSVKDTAKYKLDQLLSRTEPQAIMMCDPGHFQVIDVKNAFMEGNINATDKTKAAKQWEDLKETFERLGHKVEVVPSQPEREDMVFTANQVLLGETTDGKPFVIPSKMVHPSRQKEIPYFTKWFATNGYKMVELPGDGEAPLRFEGQGDALWHPTKQLLWAGYGHRSSESVYDTIAEKLGVPVIKLHLIHPSFYHLDTAFCPLSVDTVLVYEKAFDQNSLELIRHYFRNVISVSDRDAENFACNALPLGKYVVLQKGSADTCKALKEHGFEPVEVETGEFMKSGGSVSCLKMMIY